MRPDPTPALLACLIDGLSGKQIAEAMGWTVTRTNHALCRMYRRLGAHNAAHAVAIALQMDKA